MNISKVENFNKYQKFFQFYSFFAMFVPWIEFINTNLDERFYIKQLSNFINSLFYSYLYNIFNFFFHFFKKYSLVAFI